jgi:pimeloyl-ACP methyl ester carboxylesterase
LIHGNFAGKSWWRELLAEPPPNTRLIAPDMPGFGDSPGGEKFKPYITRYARSLARFLDSLEVERCVLVGHSFGGAVATELALSDPERFPAMFLLSPAPLDGLPASRYLEPLLESYRHDRRGLRRAIKRVMRTRVPPYLEDLVDEARKMHPANFTGNARLLSEWNLNGRSRLYTNPVLVASGDRDTLVPPYSARTTARAFPVGAYALLRTVGHSPQIEAPEKVQELLTILLQRLG